MTFRSIGVRGWIDRWLETRYGLHSNIPRCCVDAYVHDRYEHRIGDIAYQRWVSYGLDWTDIREKNVQYVLCHECMDKYCAGHREFNTIHDCGNGWICRGYRVLWRLIGWAGLRCRVRRFYSYEIPSMDPDESYYEWDGLLDSVPTLDSESA